MSNPDGTDAKRLTKGLAPGQGNEFGVRNFDWSASGERLLVAVTGNVQLGFPSSLVVIELSTGKMKRIFTDNAWFGEAIFTADQAGITFASRLGGGPSGIFFVKADGSDQPRKLPNTTGEELSLQSTPDGSALYFRRDAHIFVHRLTDDYEARMTVPSQQGDEYYDCLVSRTRSIVLLARRRFANQSYAPGVDFLVARPLRRPDGTVDWTTWTSVTPIACDYPWSFETMNRMAWLVDGREALLTVWKSLSADLTASPLLRLNLQSGAASPILLSGVEQSPYPSDVGAGNNAGVFVGVPSPMAP